METRQAALERRYAESVLSFMLIVDRLPPFDLNEVRTCLLGQAARRAAEHGIRDFDGIERMIDLIEERGHIRDSMATIAPVVEFYRLLGTARTIR